MLHSCKSQKTLATNSNQTLNKLKISNIVTRSITLNHVGVRSGGLGAARILEVRVPGAQGLSGGEEGVFYVMTKKKM